MKKYNKESLQTIKDMMTEENYYLPKPLFDRQNFGFVRLETKMAYVAILDTLLKKPNYNNDGEAFLKIDNPEIIHTLETLTNKKIDKDKLERYYQELIIAEMITIDKKNVFLMDISDYDNSTE
jgi:hypothetical protein